MDGLMNGCRKLLTQSFKSIGSIQAFTAIPSGKRGIRAVHVDTAICGCHPHLVVLAEPDCNCRPALLVGFLAIKLVECAAVNQ